MVVTAIERWSDTDVRLSVQLIAELNRRKNRWVDDAVGDEFTPNLSQKHRVGVSQHTFRASKKRVSRPVNS